MLDQKTSEAVKPTIQIRNQFGGAFIVELLVAVVVASIMGTAIVNTMSDSMRVTTKAQSQVQATAIAQQVIDACRNREFDSLVTPAASGGCLGTNQTLVVNGTTGTGTYPAIFPRSLVLDLNDPNSVWNQQAKDNQFRGTVTVDCTGQDTNGGGDLANIAVTVSWYEGAAQREYKTSAVINRFGLRSN